jgi:hypothetical protein
LRHHNPDLVLLDLQLGPGISIDEQLEYLRNHSYGGAHGKADIWRDSLASNATPGWRDSSSRTPLGA